MKLSTKKGQKLSPELKKLKPKIVSILRKNGVQRAGVFGSYARGEQKRGSDIDLLVKTKKKTSLFGFAGIKLELQDVLGKKVDLVEYEVLKPLLRERVLKEEIRLI